MKSQLIIFLFFLAFSVTHAQRIDLPSEYIRQNLVGNTTIYSNVQGSRYFNEAFISSKIHLKDNKPFIIPLRYDPLNDEMQMNSNNQIVYLIKVDSLKIELSDKVYEIYEYSNDANSEKGYFINLTPNEKVQLLLQERKEYVEGKKAQNSYTVDKAPSFKDLKNYYLNKDHSLTKISLSKKNILELLNDKKNELKDYLTKNKLKEEEDFINLVKFYNQL